MDDTRTFTFWYCDAHDDGCIAEGTEIPAGRFVCWRDSCASSTEDHGYLRYSESRGLIVLEMLRDRHWYINVQASGFEPEYFASTIIYADGMPVCPGLKRAFRRAIKNADARGMETADM